MTGEAHSNQGSINEGWLVLGTLLSETVCPEATRPQATHGRDARTCRSVKGLLRRLIAWLMRPLPEARDASATDAATRLEILSRGGFRR